MQVSRRIKPLCLVMFLAACGSDSESSPNNNSPEPPSNNTSTPSENNDQPEEPMRIPDGLYKITRVDADETCDRFLPAENNLVQIDSNGLSYGDSRLPNDELGGFFGCSVLPPLDHETAPHAFSSLTVTQDATDRGYTLAFDIESFDGRYRRPCKEAVVEIEPFEACELKGRYETNMVEIQEGSCDSSWSSDAVEIHEDENGELVLDWGNQMEVSITPSDDICGFQVTKGVSTEEVQDDWLYNNALRSVSLEWEQEGHEGTVRLEDKIQGMTFDGTTCQGATFSISLERYTGIAEDLTEFESTCSHPAPPECGDGMCVEGENCANCAEDCGCGDGEDCDFKPDPSQELVDREWMCFKQCESPLSTGACGDGERCGLIRDPLVSKFHDYRDSEFHCVEALASQPVGASCSRLSECEDGLVCHITGNNFGLGTCREPCDDTCDGNNETCAPMSLDPSGFNSLPGGFKGCVSRCEPLTTEACGGAEDLICSQEYCASRATDTGQEGASCEDDTPCAPGLTCITTTPSDGSPQYSACRLPCDTDVDCDALSGTSCVSVQGRFGVCLVR